MGRRRPRTAAISSVADETALAGSAPPSPSTTRVGASAGACGAYVLWDAPARETMSFSAAALGEDGRDLEVAAHIWLGDGGGVAESRSRANWHDGAPAPG